MPAHRRAAGSSSSYIAPQDALTGAWTRRGQTEALQPLWLREKHAIAAPLAPSSSPGNPAREPGSGEGMASVRPAKDRPLRDETEALQDAADTGLALPHERDQSSGMTNAETDSQVKQASRDLRRGLQDTDKGKPMNEAYRKLKR